MSRFKLFAVVVFVILPLTWIGADIYTEDFEQADGPPEDWVIVRPDVTVEAGELVLTSVNAGEVDAIAGQGETGLWFQNISKISFDIRYPNEPAVWAYDHGGIIFCAQSAEGRYGGNTCYVIDYLALADGNPLEGRFRLGRFINGAEGGITEAPAVDNIYEGLWEIELTDTTIAFSFNGVEQFSVENTEVPRSGYVAFWAYNTPVDNQVVVDNLTIEHTPGPCPVALADSIVMTEGKENAVLPIHIPIGANDAAAYEVTVTSQDPAIASVVTPTMTFAVGDPLAKNAEIHPEAPGQTMIAVGVTGEDCDSAAMAEVLRTVAFEEDFTQDDGPPEGWYIASDTAEVINGELSLHAPGQPFLWFASDGVPINVPKIDAVRCKIRFGDVLSSDIGAHGGMYLAPAYGSARAQGYMIDVIERASDNGFRIYKDNAATVQLGGPRQPYVWDDLWHDWELEFTTTGFTFKVDGGDDPDDANVTVGDLTYRGGYLSFWCYTGDPASDQNMFVDDIEVEFGSSACPSIAPAAASNRPLNPKTVFTVTTPFGINADGAYEVIVTSTNPAVAVPVGAVDGSLILTFPQSHEVVSTTFEAECLGPGTTEFVLDTGAVTCLVSSSASFTVRVPGEPEFCDDFAQADGPPENWTAYLGDWQVTGGNVVVGCAPGEIAQGETWLWAGNPATPLEAQGTEGSLSFKLVDLVQTNPELDTADPPVGRHGGFMFFASEPTYRYANSGYEIDWIDRTTDHGYRFLRSDNGTHTVIAGPTLDAFEEVGTEWLVEWDDTTIQFWVDGQLVFDVADSTYREGYMGLWTYCNTTQGTFDNVAFGDTCEFGEGPEFKRGDANRDGAVNIADAVYVLQNLFAQGPAILCMDAADSNDDESVNIADAVYILQNLFAQGPAILPPGPITCGVDPTGHPQGGPDLPACDYCASACGDPVVPCAPAVK